MSFSGVTISYRYASGPISIAVFSNFFWLADSAPVSAPWSRSPGVDHFNPRSLLLWMSRIESSRMMMARERMGWDGVFYELPRPAGEGWAWEK